MSLIKCTECGREISDQASACPNCGNPMAPILIEKTSKDWKILKLISLLVIVGAILLVFIGLNDGGFKNYLTGLGLYIGGFGLIVFIVAKFGSWWSHD